MASLIDLFKYLTIIIFKVMEFHLLKLTRKYLSNLKKF